MPAESDTTVHNHDYDPSCTERWVRVGPGIQYLKGACLAPPEPYRNDLESPSGTSVDQSPTNDAKGPQISGEEVRVTAPSGGQKGSKPARFDLIPGDALWKVAELYGRGADKYEDRNWERGYDWSLSFAALQRHAWQFWNGEDIDAESGQPHMASVVFHALALLRFMDGHRDYDNRPSTERQQRESKEELMRLFGMSS